MNASFIIFSMFFLLGQVGGIPLSGGMTLYLHDVLLVFMIAAFLAVRKPWRRITRDSLVKPLSFFAAACVLSLAVNVSRYTGQQNLGGLFYLLRFLAYNSLYFVVANKSIRMELVTVWLYAVPLVMSLLGILQVLLYPNIRNLWYLGWDPHFGRLVSTLFDPNFMGLISVMGFLYGLSMSRSVNRVWLIAMQGVLLISIILTYSRSTYIALICGILFFAFSSKMKRVLVALALGMVLYIFIPKSGLDVTRLLRVDSSLSRIVSAQKAFVLIRDAPVFGHGFNTLRYLVQTDNDGAENPPSHAGAGIDTSFLFVWAASGLLGFSAFVYLLYSVWSVGGGLEDMLLQSVYYAVLLAAGIHSLFNNSLFYPWVLMYIWILAGYIRSLRKSSE